MWSERRRKKLRATPIPAEWKQIITANCPFYSRLPTADRQELEGYIQVFLAEKHFEGCEGLILSPDMQVCIAAQACLLLLHRNAGCYPGLSTVLVYPNPYAAPIARHIGSGIMEEGHQTRAGESWGQGVVILTWDHVQQSMIAEGKGYNIIWHEFAHQLDFEDGVGNGVPLLSEGNSIFGHRSRYRSWSKVMMREYEQLRAQAQRGEPTLLRYYGATNPAEFFAVATECFFSQPQALQTRHPELYAELKRYYCQDPANWLSAPNHS